MREENMKCAKAGSPLRSGQRCQPKADKAPGNAPSGDVPRAVARENGSGAGVGFRTYLDASIPALQLIVDQGLLAREEAA